MADEAIRLIAEEGRRLLTRQEADLDTLRNRVATILSASSIVAAVFGGALTDTNPGDTDARKIAFGLFALTVAICVGILFPREWKFSVGLGGWIKKIGTADALDEDAVAYNLAKEYDSHRGFNGPRIRRRQSWFAVACAALGAQVIAWAFVVL